MKFADLTTGRRIALGPLMVDEQDIIAFAEKYDRQWFHTDPALAADGPFQGLIASGWHTCAMAMSLVASGVLQGSESYASPGLAHVRWPTPVRPGDQLTLELEVLEPARLRQPAMAGHRALAMGDEAAGRGRGAGPGSDQHVQAGEPGARVARAGAAAPGCLFPYSTEPGSNRLRCTCARCACMAFLASAGIALAQRLDQRPVLVLVGQAPFRRQALPLQLSPLGPLPFLAHQVEDRQHDAVMRGFGQAAVQGAVPVLELFEAGSVFGVAQAVVHRGEVGAVGIAYHHVHQGRFEGDARLHQLRRAGAGARRRPRGEAPAAADASARPARHRCRCPRTA